MGTTRTQLPKNKSLYLGMAVFLILVLSYVTWGLISNRAFSKTTLEVSNLNISKNELLADGDESSLVDITITNLDTGSLASNVWVGLKIADDQIIDEEFSYFGWYSPSPNRSFYQTDQDGNVRFQVKSTLVGDITYGVFAADPEQKNSGKYQNLNKEFTLSFK